MKNIKEIYVKCTSEQKTIIIILAMIFLFIAFLILLPSENVGVYMHNVSHTKIGKSSQTLYYHCVVMERSFGEDNHIKYFEEDDFESAKTLYLELKQLEPEKKVSSSRLLKIFAIIGLLATSFTIFAGIMFIIDPNFSMQNLHQKQIKSIIESQ